MIKFALQTHLSTALFVSSVRCPYVLLGNLCQVILLDIDTLPLKPLSALFELEPPAALASRLKDVVSHAIYCWTAMPAMHLQVRGSSDMEHGAVIDGRHPFAQRPFYPQPPSAFCPRLFLQRGRWGAG